MASTEIDVTPQMELFPGEVRDARYKSDWESNVVVVDLAHPLSPEPRLTSFYLEDVPLSGFGGKGVYQLPMKLGDFPEWVSAVKIAINRLLTRHKDNPSSAVPRHVNNFSRVFSYLLRQGYYRLSDVPPFELTTLAETLANSTWRSVLNYRRSLAAIYIKSKLDPVFAANFKGSGNVDMVLNISALEAATGLKIPPQEISPFFRRRMWRLWSSTLPKTNPDECITVVQNGANLQATMSCLNMLSELPAGINGLQFIPFPTASRTLDLLRESQPGKQTSNIDLPSAIKIFKHSCLWVYDRAPVVLELLRITRRLIDACPKQDDTSSTWLNKALRAELIARQGELNLWFTPSEATLNVGGAAVKKFFEHLIIAACCAIGITHARRVNELAGEGLPYGLYFGCVTLLNRLPEDWRIELYAEKGSKDWLDFPANQFIADCVNVLERAINEIRPLGTPEKTPAEDLDSRRRDFLVVTRNLSLHGFDKKQASSLKFRPALNDFLEDAGMPSDMFHGSQWPFRRCFCWLFTHRHDHPELLALSDHLDHLSVSATIPYQSDLSSRPQGGSIREILGQAGGDSAAFLAELRQFEVQHLISLIQDLLEGKEVGGMFPRVVVRLAHQLSKNAEFLSKEIEDKSAELGRLLSRHGYRANAMKHITCAASGAKATARSAKCYGDGRVRPELASPELCNNCVHGISNEVNSRRIEIARVEFKAQSQDASLPGVIRAEAKSYEETLQRVLEAAKKITAGNREAVEELFQKWEELVTK
jgi:hypothetical protein